MSYYQISAESRCQTDRSHMLRTPLLLRIQPRTALRLQRRERQNGLSSSQGQSKCADLDMTARVVRVTHRRPALELSSQYISLTVDLIPMLSDGLVPCKGLHGKSSGLYPWRNAMPSIPPETPCRCLQSLIQHSHLLQQIGSIGNYGTRFPPCGTERTRILRIRGVQDYVKWNGWAIPPFAQFDWCCVLTACRLDRTH